MDEIAVTVIVVVAALFAAGIAVVSRRRRSRRQVEGPDRSLPAVSHRDPSPAEVDSRPASIAVLGDDNGSTYRIDVAEALPSDGFSVPAGMASEIFAELTRAAPTVMKLKAGGEVYRLVKAPPGGLSKVVGDPSRVRGFGSQGHGSIRHGEFSKVRPSGVVTPALALMVASAALGAYWQQQMDAKLEAIDESLRAIRGRLDHELDAQIELAEQTLNEHEAAPPSGRYEPPASVTEGMLANRIQRLELAEVRERLRSLDGEQVSHQQYNREVMGDGRTRLDRQIYRALRGLAVELRVLRLKRISAHGEGETYHAELDRQQEQLGDEVELILELLQLAAELEPSEPGEERRVSLPGRRQRQQRERERAGALRDNVNGLLLSARQIELVAAVPDAATSYLEMYLSVEEDGEVRAMLASGDDVQPDA